MSFFRSYSFKKITTINYMSNFLTENFTKQSNIVKLQM